LDTCPKGCKDLRGRPIEMKTGKIISKKSGRFIRKYCPKCFVKVEEPEKKG